MKRAKERIIPIHTSKIEENGSVVYLMDKCQAKFFKGRAINPTHYIQFRTEEHRDQYIKKFFNDVAESLAYKAKRKAEAEEAKKKAVSDCDVGDIYVDSWGYDQTNVDFYKVIERKKASATIVKIGKTCVYDNGPTTKVVPDPDRIVGESMLKRIGQYGFRINSFSSATKWNNEPMYQTGSGWGH